jgi:hypothetical protein
MILYYEAEVKQIFLFNYTIKYRNFYNEFS